jgi:hypothetical protein
VRACCRVRRRCHRALQMPPGVGASNTASYQMSRSEHPFTISSLRQAHLQGYCLPVTGRCVAC